VRTAQIDVGAIVMGLDAGLGLGVGKADSRDTVLHGDAVGTGIGSKVVVEGAILLHDHDDVLDLVDRGRAL
jgi:hypothetical protein